MPSSDIPTKTTPTTEKTVPERTEKTPDSMRYLVHAFNAFRDEGIAATDPAVKQAAFEDAATVAYAMTVIERGINRGKYRPAKLQTVIDTGILIDP